MEGVLQAGKHLMVSRNRYWLVENMLNSRYTMMHDIYYNYYRLGMDKMYEDENGARAEILNVLNLLSIISIMIIPIR